MMPVEVLRDHFLSPLRCELAKELRSRGWGQRAIAEALGISQAAVSKVLAEDRSEKLRDLGIKDLEKELLIERLITPLQRGNPEEAAALANRYWLLVAASGSACKLHGESGWRFEGCTACTKALYPRLSPARGIALADVERAVVLAESSRCLAYVAPEVMINIARAAQGAATTRDVVAVPGRLARVGNRLIARGRPSFGASKHLAEVLLASGYSACIDIKFDSGVREALRYLRLEWREFSSEEYRSPNPAASAVSELRSSGRLPSVVVDVGGRGIEPVTYIFGGSAVEVVLAAEGIARAIVGAPSQ